MSDDEVRSLHAFQDETDRARLIATLVHLRIQQGLTQAQVAQRMGVTQSTVSDFERGGSEGRDNSVSIVQRYARAIEVELRMWIEPNSEAPE